MVGGTFCPKCGYSNPPQRGACLMCYGRLDLTGGGRQCPHCGGEVGGDFRFCGSCGGALQEEAVAVAGAVALAGALLDRVSSYGGYAEAESYVGEEYAGAYVGGEEEEVAAAAPEPVPTPPAVEEVEEMFVPPPPGLVTEPVEEFAPPPPPPAEEADEAAESFVLPPPPPPDSTDLGGDEDFGWELELPTEDETEEQQ